MSRAPGRRIVRTSSRAPSRQRVGNYASLWAWYSEASRSENQSDKEVASILFRLHRGEVAHDEARSAVAERYEGMTPRHREYVQKYFSVDE